MKNLETVFNIKGVISWVARNEHGVIFAQGGHSLDLGEHNQVQKLATDSIIDTLQTVGTDLKDIDAMRIGAGSGVGWTGAALNSNSSVELSTGSEWTESQPTSGVARVVVTFTNVAETITEAGLFSDGAGLAELLFYDDTTISVTLQATDSLQVTWDVSAGSN